MDTTPRYGAIHVPVMSFFAPDLYRDVGVRWRGTGLALLFFVVAVMMIPQAVAVHMSVRHVAEHVAPVLLPQLPAIVVENGRARTEPEGPRTVNDPRTGLPLLRVDTSSTADSVGPDEPPMLLTSTALLLRRPDGTVQRLDLKDVAQLRLDGPSLAGALETMRVLAAPMMYPVSVLLVFMGQVMKVLLLAWVGRMYTARLPAQLKYPVCMRLAVVALTPALVVGTLMDVLDVEVPLSFVVATVATFSYLVMGIGAVYSEEDPEADEG